MTFKDMLKKSVLDGFSGNNLSLAQILVVLAVTTAFALYLFLVYYVSARRSLYDRDFHISLALISVVTAGIILAMQSNLVISLGMVGALSIVRFRTAVKSSKDLVFLFWSISNGIICGAGMFEIALAVNLLATIGLFGLELTPAGTASLLLVVNASDPACEEAVLQAVAGYARHYRVRSRNVTQSGIDLIVELRVREEGALVRAVSALPPVTGVTLLAHDGEISV